MAIDNYTCLLNEVPHTVQSGSFRKLSYIDLPNRPDAPVKKSFIVDEVSEVLNCLVRMWGSVKQKKNTYFSILIII